METAINDLKKGIENLKTEEKRLAAAAINQKAELCRIERNWEETQNQIRDYETALTVLLFAMGPVELKDKERMADLIEKTTKDNK